ncbi:MAG: DUF2147 domain-containing protein [Tidjanibacter sp.]|nr:DUF2147 domain-containing protein [Tidjanibacter sp.]
MRVPRNVLKNISRVLLTAALSFFALSAAADNNTSTITGIYMTHDDSAKVEIYADGELCQGKALWNSRYGDVANRNILILRNLAYSPNSDSWIGKLYDPFDEREYNVAVKPLGNGELQVTPSLGSVSRKLIWHKILPTANN